MITKNGKVSRMDVINALIEKNKYTSYLEIGVQNEICFNAIDSKGIYLTKKIGVDPEKGGTHKMTSDEFFENWEMGSFDIIFIDGLHHSEQVYKDINNALEILDFGGTIVCHDMIPSSFESQLVPRQTKVWNGDCWKAFVKLREREDLEMRTIDTDCGLGIIRKGKQKPLSVLLFTYNEFERCKKEWLNIITVEEFKELYL